MRSLQVDVASESSRGLDILARVLGDRAHGSKRPTTTNGSGKSGGGGVINHLTGALSGYAPLTKAAAKQAKASAAAAVDGLTSATDASTPAVAGVLGGGGGKRQRRGAADMPAAVVRRAIIHLLLMYSCIIQRAHEPVSRLAHPPARNTGFCCVHLDAVFNAAVAIVLGQHVDSSSPV